MKIQTLKNLVKKSNSFNTNLTNAAQSKLITVNSENRIKYDQAFLVDSNKLPTVAVYKNSIKDKNLITSLYKDVRGIYLWHNLVNGKHYVGSGHKLSARLSQYYYPSHLLSNRHFSNSILKYGHNNFSLIILELCGQTGTISKADYLAREQYYIDLYKPELKINPKADSTLGFKHSEETKQLISEFRTGKSMSEETRARLSELFSVTLNPFYGKTHTSEPKLKDN